MTTDLDVANASAQLRTTLAQIPGLEQQEAAEINALSLLLGQPPNALRGELADGAAGAAGAAARAGRAAVRTGAPAPRRDAGRGATACRNRQ